ncbi:MAG: heparinase, partial [Novosphingobium sp.]
MAEAMNPPRDEHAPAAASANSSTEADIAIPLGGESEAATITPAAKPEVQSELIEPGRALALADFNPPVLGAGERLLRMAYRLGVPGSTLAAPFRKPSKPRLLATVLNPLPGNKVAGTALRAGHFLVHGVKAPIAQIDFAGAARLTPPLERAVHSFAWLADLEACAAREQ